MCAIDQLRFVHARFTISDILVAFGYLHHKDQRLLKPCHTYLATQDCPNMCAIVHPLLTPQVILTIFISFIVDTFVSQYRLSEKLRETLKKNQEEEQPQEGLIAFCTKQALSCSWVTAHPIRLCTHCMYVSVTYIARETMLIIYVWM